ncbi:hypothetical protein OAQ99_06815 [Candidatus Kapabacteria bacterium]|nr:hypothetical protein [Candidatus Kapabacteria bacterium]
MKINPFKIIGVLILLGFASAFLFLPTEIKVNQEISINSDINNVFNIPNTISTWENWSPWRYTQKHVSTKYKGPKSGVGSKYIWESDSIPQMNGRLEITVSEKNKRIVGSIFYDSMGETPAYNTEFFFFDEKEFTRVVWQISDEVSWYHLPNRFLLFGAEIRLKEMLNTGLDSLKHYVDENNN